MSSGCISMNAAASMVLVIVKLLIAIALVVAASHVLIPAIKEAAERLNVPEGIVAATLVAFGTSLPELVTAVTAALKKHGDLAVGNVFMSKDEMKWGFGVVLLVIYLAVMVLSYSMLGGMGGH